MSDAAKGFPGTTDTYKKGGPWDPEARSAATPSPADTIRTALQGAMVGAWGRENALRALAEIEAENERLRREIESLRPHVEGIGYAG